MTPCVTPTNANVIAERLRAIVNKNMLILTCFSKSSNNPLLDRTNSFKYLAVALHQNKS